MWVCVHVWVHGHVGGAHTSSFVFALHARVPARPLLRERERQRKSEMGKEKERVRKREGKRETGKEKERE